MGSGQNDINITSVEGGEEIFLRLKAASRENADRIMAGLSKDNSGPELPKRFDVADGYYVFADLNKAKKTHLAVRAVLYPSDTKDGKLEWTVSISRPLIVEESSDNPRRFAAIEKNREWVHVKDSNQLDKARELVAKKLLEDGIVTPEQAQEIAAIKTYSEKFTKAHFSFANELHLEGASPETVKKLEASFSLANGDPRRKDRWQESAGWLVPQPKGSKDIIAIKADHGPSDRPWVSFTKPVYLEAVPGQPDHFTPQFRQDGNLKTQGMTADLRESMGKLVEKLTAEGFIDKTCGEEIIKDHEAYLKQHVADMERRADSEKRNHAETVKRERGYQNIPHDQLRHRGRPNYPTGKGGYRG